jgi:hypothetical protein
MRDTHMVPNTVSLDAMTALVGDAQQLTTATISRLAVADTPDDLVIEELDFWWAEPLAENSVVRSTEFCTYDYPEPLTLAATGGTA